MAHETMVATESTRTQAGSDLVLLLGRVGLGILMIWHTKVAWDYTGGVAGMVTGFEQAGIPLPELTARANLFGELIGGILLILGVGVRTVGVLMAVNMAGAWYYVHTSGLYAMDRNGPELVIALALLSLMLAATGPGRLGLDHLRASHRS
jgi:putative oxidoreductase